MSPQKAPPFADGLPQVWGSSDTKGRLSSASPGPALSCSAPAIYFFLAPVDVIEYMFTTISYYVTQAVRKRRNSSL